MTLAGLIAVQVRPAGNGASDRDTVPLKAPTGATVIVEMADCPALTVAGEVAETVKSVTTKLTVTAWERVPLVPVTVTENGPTGVTLQESVAVAGDGGRVTLLARVHVTPDGNGVSDKPTMPANPLTAVTVMVEEPEPAERVTGLGLAAMVKSTKVSVAVAV